MSVGAGAPGSRDAGTVSRSGGPDFLCVGAQKAGTQWLYDQLAPHPDFWLPPIKEFHHFDLPGSRRKLAEGMLARAEADLDDFNAFRQQHQRRALVERDVAFLRRFVAMPPGVDIEAYAALFDDKGASIAGDVTPGYSILEPEVIATIVARFPDLKVIFIARDPVDRFWSAFNMRLRRGDLKGRADIRSVERFAAREGVMSRSRQSVTVRRWREAIPADRFALFFFDDLVADPATLRREVLTFLGGSPDAAATVEAGFNRKGDNEKVPMDAAMQAAIARILADELKACAAEFGGRAVAWARRG